MKEIKGGPIPIVIFTEEEKKGLQDKLKEFPETNVSLFIMAAQSICNAFLLKFHDRVDFTKYGLPCITDHTEKTTALFKKIKKTVKYLSEIANGQFLPLSDSFGARDIIDSVDRCNEIEKDPNYQRKSKAVTLACELVEKLEALSNLFRETQHKEVGSPGNPYSEFTELIVAAYRRYLGEPMASVNDTFPLVLKILFCAVQIELKVPVSMVRKILKKPDLFSPFK